jgi:D-tyrosyl-tRNA(Tyr) deacylase
MPANVTTPTHGNELEEELTVEMIVAEMMDVSSAQLSAATAHAVVAVEHESAQLSPLRTAHVLLVLGVFV